jgi:5-methylcytosine-specific restriction endonuclease McrA
MSRSETAKTPCHHLPMASPAIARKATPTTATKIRSKQRWKLLSIRVRQQEPWCADPFGLHERRNQPAPSKAVHHIVAISDDPQHAHTRDNLAALCTSCHSIIEGKERQGETTMGLFGVKGGAGQLTFPARAATNTRRLKKSE